MDYMGKDAANTGDGVVTDSTITKPRRDYINYVRVDRTAARL